MENGYGDRGNQLDFLEKLNGLLQIAAQKNQVLTVEEVEQYFEQEMLSREQMELVYDYLLAQKVAVRGYVKQGGTIQSSDDAKQEQFTEEERQYLQQYMEDLRLIEAEVGAEIAGYYRAVVDMAKELHRPELFLGDLIQEGNVGLMMALQDAECEEAQILDGIRQAMQMLVEEQTESRSQDHKIVEKVNALDETITKLTEELGRKVTIEELAIYMETDVDEILDLLRVAGEELDDEQMESVADVSEILSVSETAEMPGKKEPGMEDMADAMGAQGEEEEFQTRPKRARDAWGNQ